MTETFPRAGRDDASETWSGDGGARDEDAGRHLGVDVELRVQWRPTPWLLVDAGYDHWFKGSYLDRVSNVSSTSDSDYVYLQTRFWF